MPNKFSHLINSQGTLKKQYILIQRTINEMGKGYGYKEEDIETTLKVSKALRYTLRTIEELLKEELQEV